MQAQEHTNAACIPRKQMEFLSRLVAHNFLGEKPGQNFTLIKELNRHGKLFGRDLGNPPKP